MVTPFSLYGHNRSSICLTLYPPGHAGCARWGRDGGRRHSMHGGGARLNPTWLTAVW